MQNRRDFLQKAGLAMTAAMIAPSAITSALASSAAAKQKIGIQLFTLREQLLKDVQGTIAQVAKVGYQQVETFYGYAGPN
ncbi:MAG: twin-arginine translocation signal domain-containing protein, partial [Pedobacter sp.]